MKILLTGYAGFLGKTIARVLKASGHSVRVVLHRRSVTRRDFRYEADELLWGSLDDPAVMARALTGVDCVIHSAWKFSKQNDKRPTANETITEALFKESVAAGVRKFAFISSVAVYGMQSRKDAAVAEDSPLASEADQKFIYPSEKIAAEKMLQSAAKGQTLLGVFRPGPIFDDRKGPIKKVMGGGKKPLAIGFGTGRNHMPYIHADDVADAVVRWIDHGSQNVTLNVTPAECMRHRDWYRAWGKARGRNVRTLFIRGFMLRFAAFGAGMLKRLMGKKGKVDVDYVLASATRNIVYSNARARQVLGWEPRATNGYRP